VHLSNRPDSAISEHNKHDPQTFTLLYSDAGVADDCK